MSSKSLASGGHLRGDHRRRNSSRDAASASAMVVLFALSECGDRVFRVHLAPSISPGKSGAIEQHASGAYRLRGRGRLVLRVYYGKNRRMPGFAGGAYGRSKKSARRWSKDCGHRLRSIRNSEDDPRLGDCFNDSGLGNNFSDAGASCSAKSAPCATVDIAFLVAERAMSRCRTECRRGAGDLISASHTSSLMRSVRATSESASAENDRIVAKPGVASVQQRA